MKRVIAVAAVIGITSAVSLLAAEITIVDNNPGISPFGNFFDGGPFGTAREDNETEPGTVSNQSWDLEAMVLSSGKLYLIGGFNFNIGQDGYDPGDLFIKIGGSAPTGNPTTPGYGTIANSTYGYNFAVVLNGGLGSPATVHGLNGSSVLNTVQFDQLVANPWTYNSGAASTTTTPISYTVGLSDAAILGSYGVSLVGGTHNVLAIDLAFMGSVSQGVWFSYTMECGNDSLKGYADGGFRIPDGGLTLGLLGLGLASLHLFGRKTRA